MSSSYQLTCQYITIDGNVLSAVCQRRDGSWNETSLVLMGIENIDGVLRVTDPSQEASFHLSSENISVDGDVLSAECRKIDGD
ncbi:CVNH domain-containing protein [Kamptonema formosum]|uniref:CVNH domain-containing protein n=1 Tax=Kamptonema formosum TaxID=331992 RepID=UPI0003452CF3|nr:CVNH domain-containing protein [Oscillatoria sp. PCC 10802]